VSPRDPSPERVVSDVNAAVLPAASGEFAPLVLGPLQVWPPVVLAPMAGVTNLAFRSLCREYGAGLYVSEMITARGFLMGNRLTALLASSDPSERPRSVQVYGSDPVDLGEMVRVLVGEGVDHLDINFGCPVPKVTRSGGGSAIPAKPKLVARLVRAMVANAGDVPVTVKMRKGIDDELITFRAAGRVAQEEGASAVGLHARTAAELYSGEADWSAIGELKADLDVPVLGNGDIWECWDALRMMRATGCDGVIVGRGCLGRPWLFAELAAVFDGREPDRPPTLGRIREILLDHARRMADFFGEPAGMRQMRKWGGWYTKGFRGAVSVRNAVARIETLADLERALEGLAPDEPFPLAALTVNRAKRGGTQRVTLPEGYLDARDDDTPPRGPHRPEEIEAWERALTAGG
jgi:nifR3 family TIM-barrel protein